MNQLRKIGLSFSITLVAVIVLSITSCNIGGVSKPATTYFYLFQKNAAIDIDTTHQTTKNGDTAFVLHFSIQKRNDLVFTYRKMKPDYKNGTDSGGLLRRLVFQIPSKMKKFSYQDSQLQKIQALYRSDCPTCAQNGLAVPVKRGSINGERINPVTWIINIDVMIDYFGDSIHLKFHEPFFEKSLLQ